MRNCLYSKGRELFFLGQKINYCIRKQGETESGGTSMSSIHPQTFCEHQDNCTPTNGNECVIMQQHHKNLNPSTSGEFFSLICQKKACFLQRFCVITRSNIFWILSLSQVLQLISSMMSNYIISVLLCITTQYFDCAVGEMWPNFPEIGPGWG